MSRHHRLALATIGAAGVLACGLGAWFGEADRIGIWRGLYFGVVTATTTGYGDIVPRGWLPHVLAVGLMVTAIPLWSASFSLFTAALAGSHVAAAERRVKAHMEARLRHHLGGADVREEDQGPAGGD